MTDIHLNHELPEFREMGIPAVRLMQGVLYAEDEAAWEVLLSYELDIADYFARVGLSLVIDRAEGLAYLRQLGDEERMSGYERLPRLFRRTPLGYDATLLCVLLREEYRRFEDEGLDLWWVDWQQGKHSRIPGIDPLWMLNHYHFLDSALNNKRPLTFSRYAGPGSHRSPIGFSGDTVGRPTHAGRARRATVR